MIGVHSPRFPFTQDQDAVAERGRSPRDRVARRGGPGVPALAPLRAARLARAVPLGQGGALRWYHLGEGDYAGTEEAIREALPERNGGSAWPPLLEPIRPSDVPDVKVIAPTPEVFPGGSTEEPWSSTEGRASLELEYEAGGAYAATDGEGRIAIRIDGEEREPVEVAHPGLQELTVHERTERHTPRARPSPGCSSTRQFARLPSSPGDGVGLAARARDGELLADLAGEHEADVLVDGLELGDVVGAALAEEGDQPLDQLLGGAGARR